MTPKALICLAVLAMALPVQAQTRRDATGFPAPDRPVADIVSPIWDTEENRDEAKETEQVFAAMRLKSGMAVADIGAGSGFYTVRLSPIVGATGRVYAEDLEPDYLALLKRRVTEAKLANVTVVTGTADDPKLPKGVLEAALLVHMYHEIEQPYGLLWRLAESMKPGGKVGIVDADRATQNHGTPPKLLRCELAAVGYKQTATRVLDGGVGYLAIFEAPAPDKRPKPADIKPCKA